ncbi:MAG TPA: hypothetical protein VLB74_12310, partial [Flavobacterium sp.]|nr:hypothetical protein [Flavobacterium sp.]
ASHKHEATSLFVFSLLYGYIGFNILFFKIMDLVNMDSFFEFLIFLSPFYVIASIILFIQVVRKFNKEKHAGIQ